MSFKSLKSEPLAQTPEFRVYEQEHAKYSAAHRVYHTLKKKLEGSTEDSARLLLYDAKTEFSKQCKRFHFVREGWKAFVIAHRLEEARKQREESIELLDPNDPSPNTFQELVEAMKTQVPTSGIALMHEVRTAAIAKRFEIEGSQENEQFKMMREIALDNIKKKSESPVTARRVEQTEQASRASNAKQDEDVQEPFDADDPTKEF